MKFKLEKITPTKAKIMLKKNPNNRNLNHTHVEFLTKQMEHGTWMDNGQTVVIDANDNLSDGQHRLNAIIQSGCTLEFIVVRGIAPKAMDTIDTGKIRDASDVLTMNGIPNASAVASTVKGLMVWDSENAHLSGGGNMMGSGTKITNQNILKYHNKRKKDYQWAFKMGYKKRIGGCNVSQAMAAVMILSRVYPKPRIEAFVDKVVNGGDYSKSPTHHLPMWLRKRMDSEYKLHRYEQLFAIIYSFEKWDKEEQVSSILITRIMKSPEIFYQTYNKVRAIKEDQVELELA